MNTFFTWLNHTGPVFCGHAFWMLIQTGILFGILWCLDRLLRRYVKASFRYALWLLILVKLLLPADLALPSGIGYWFRLPEQAPIVADYIPTFEVTNTTKTTPSVSAVPQSQPVTAIDTDMPSQSAPARRMTSASPGPQVKLSLMGALFGLWLLGGCVLAAAVVYQILYVGRIRAHSHPVPDAIEDLLTECQTNIALRRKIVIKQSDIMPSPAVCGLFRPTVLIPSLLMEKLDMEKLRAVLLHELGHIQRHDLWVNMIQTILQLFYFYNPFVRLANHWIRRTREQANDEHVLWHLNGRRQNYSATLLDIAAAALARPALAMRMIGVAEPKTQLHERITLIMKKPLPKNSKIGNLGIAALVLVGLLLLPMAAGPNALAEDNKSATPLTQEQIIDQEKKLVTNMIKSFDDKDLDGFVSAYADDAILLPDQGKIAVSALGIKMAFMPEFNQDTKILKHDYTYHELWSCGEYVIAVSQDRFSWNLPSVPQMMTVLRDYLTIYQIQPDGTLKIKIEGVNLADPTSLAELPDTPAEPIFHRIESASLDAAALNEEIEKVKKLDIDFHNCFNRQEQLAAVEYYAPNATLMPVNKNPVRGPEAIKDYIIEGSKGMQHINNNQQILHAEGNDQVVIIVNQFGWVFKVLETDQVVGIPGKGIHVWQKQPDGQWKILLDIHNTNVPLDG